MPQSQNFQAKNNWYVKVFSDGLGVICATRSRPKYTMPLVEPDKILDLFMARHNQPVDVRNACFAVMVSCCAREVELQRQT